MPPTGVFSFLGNESNLDDGKSDFLILKADVPDENAAKAEATSFLVDVKKFKQNQKIKVDGATSSLGSVPTILMTNASAVSVGGPLLGLGGSKTGPGLGKQSKKKAGSSKKTTKSRSKKTAKTKASKKKAAKKSGSKTKRRKSSKAARKKAKR